VDRALHSLIFYLWGGSPKAVSKLVELFILRFAGSAGLPGVAWAKQGVSPAEPNKSSSGFIWSCLSRLANRMRHGYAFAAETANAAYYLQHGQVEDSLKAPMRLAFAGTAGVPPAAAKKMKESKRQSKQADARTGYPTGARVVLCFSILRLGFC
jgi:hypothetical protein